MAAFVAHGSVVERWLADLAVDQEVFVPQPHGQGSRRFLPLGGGAVPRIFTSYAPTLAPPTKHLLPAEELLFSFEVNSQGEVEIEPAAADAPRVLAGVRPCDLRAIYLLDRVFEEGIPEANYARRRANTILIAHACEKPCDDHCFCEAVGSLDWREGADIFLTEVDEDFVLIEAASSKGSDLTKNADFPLCDDASERLSRSRARRPKPFGRHFKRSLDGIANLLGEAWKSPLWQKHVERCFSCGTCNLVCPTCYCFDTKDETDLGGLSGRRSRTWDGCMLPNFAEVAGGHNFRADPADRQKHRVKRKFEYLSARHGEGHFCVGCGRCGRQCTSGIDIFDIVDDLLLLEARE